MGDSATAGVKAEIGSAAGVDIAAGGGGGELLLFFLIRCRGKKNRTTIAGIWTRVPNVRNLRR